MFNSLKSTWGSALLVAGVGLACVGTAEARGRRCDCAPVTTYAAPQAPAYLAAPAVPGVPAAAADNNAQGYRSFSADPGTGTSAATSAAQMNQIPVQQTIPAAKVKTNRFDAGRKIRGINS